jgi:hypothetical protein
VIGPACKIGTMQKEGKKKAYDSQQMDVHVLTYPSSDIAQNFF